MPENETAEDPRDLVFEANIALCGVIEMLSMSDGQVDRVGVEYVLRLIQNRLEPAARALNPGAYG